MNCIWIYLYKSIKIREFTKKIKQNMYLIKKLDL